MIAENRPEVQKVLLDAATELVFTVVSDDFSVFADTRQAASTGLVRTLDEGGIKFA